MTPLRQLSGVDTAESTERLRSTPLWDARFTIGMTLEPAAELVRFDPAAPH